ncbi:MAG: RnfH family protein [Betaproteobacteria bacterium]|nr:RnfH family protein [Betaproteobacteria bacterium]
MAKTPGGTIEIELVYALPREQIVEKLRVQAGTVLKEAIEQSGMLLRHPEIATGALAFGIFGRRVASTRVLREFDRVEIYRTLIADPKQVRRTRARKTAKPQR